ncbi:SDR family oxidoreductase [Aquimarina sp. 2201CG1-2-11]|uniref:SDR family oxidoreductase n=1 Tax=Aquimarina discodermiae TaxID=3231043 RepID=UPI0034628BF7
MVKDTTHNNWAIILGGSSGLGLASAQKLAQHGYNICIIHRNRKTELNHIAQEFEQIKKRNVSFISFNIDATNKEKRTEVILDLKEILGKNAKINVLIHSIAKGNLKPMVSDSKNTLLNDDFRLTINAMAISLYDWAVDLFEAKLFANDTRIISFTSEGNTKAWQHYAAVSAAKVTLEAITRNIALEFAPYGIKANCIQAGVTDTQSLRRIPGSDQIIEHSIKRNPYHRLTQPNDIANVVYLLCTKEAAWINGTTIPVDGGEHLS